MISSFFVQFGFRGNTLPRERQVFNQDMLIVYVFAEWIFRDIVTLILGKTVKFL